MLRPGNAGSNTAADHITVIEDALAQIPAALIETIEIVVRTDSAGATHAVMEFCREHRLRYSAGYELTDEVRAAILKIPQDAWIAAIATDGSERENGQIAEITDLIDLTGWPTGSRVI
ncbi:MAG TPA: transposase, partial [Solirubrobacteraceae bacterium]